MPEELNSFNTYDLDDIYNKYDERMFRLTERNMMLLVVQIEALTNAVLELQERLQVQGR